MTNTPQNWNIPELETYFKDVPETELKIRGGTITSLKKFVSSHLEIVRANEGKPFFYPYYNRLIKLKKHLENERTNSGI